MNTILQRRIEEAAEKYSKKFETWNVDDDTSFPRREGFEDGATFALQNQWISVKEALPPYEEDVIVYFIHSDYNLNGNMFCHRTRRDDVSTDKNGFCIYNNEIITHWMSIPSLEGGEE